MALGPKPATRPKNRLNANPNFVITKELVKSSVKHILKGKDIKNKTPKEIERLNLISEKSAHAKTILRDLILSDYLTQRLKKADPKYKAKVYDEVNKLHLIKDKYLTKGKQKEFDDVIKEIFRELRGFELGTTKHGKLNRKNPIPDEKIYEFLRERRIILEHRN